MHTTHVQSNPSASNLSELLRLTIPHPPELASSHPTQVSSSKLAILFKFLHQLVRLLTKTAQRLPFVGGGGVLLHTSALGGGVGGGVAASAGGHSPFEPFSMCAVRLAQAQVDVGRRMDLTSCVTGFLKSLALYDKDFQTLLINSVDLLC